MPWTAYVPALAKSPPAGPVSLTVAKTGTPTLLIDDPTRTKLGWTVSTTLAIEIGDGEHAGKIRISPRSTARSLLVKPPGGHYKRSRLALGRMPCLGSQPYRGPVEYSLDRLNSKEAALVVILPDAVRAKAPPAPIEDDDHQLPAGTAAAVKRAMGRV